MQLSPDEVRSITAYLNIHAEAEQADLAFVPGTRLPDPAHIAAELHTQGRIPLVVLTGGVNRETRQQEALVHRGILLAAGVPDAQLIVECESANTLENVTFALPLIRSRLVLEAVDSIVVIAKWMHARRTVMTLKRHFPAGIRYYAHTYHPEGITPENWYRSQEGMARVLKNWHSIPRYLEWDHIAEIEQDDGAWV